MARPAGPAGGRWGRGAAGKGWRAEFVTGCVYYLGLIARRVRDWREEELPIIYEGK